MIFCVHLYQVYDASDKTTSIDRTTFTLKFICDLKQNLNGLHELKSWNGQSRDLPTVVEKKRTTSCTKLVIQMVKAFYQQQQK